MLDRASTFANPNTVALLQSRFVSVALDQAYQRRQKDTEGEFYRKIAAQGPRDLERTTQGFYIATASGQLLQYNNNRDPEKLLRLLRAQLVEFDKLSLSEQSPIAIESQRVDSRYNPAPDEDGLIVRVRSKILSGYEPTNDRWRKIFQSAVSRDNLWVRSGERRSLASGGLPKSLQQRIARFHLVDSTRGEPPMWRKNEIRDLRLALNEGTLTGTVHLESASGDRGYRADLRGRLTMRKDKIVGWDMVARGNFWGEGPHTRGAPKGEFPLVVTFELADGSDIADRIPPQGSRGWLAGYL